VGVVVTTSTTVPETLRMVFRVDEPGLDLVLSHPVFSNGSADIALNLDGGPLGTLSMLAAGFTTTFWQDFETVIARNLSPGYHVLLCTTSSSGGIGVHCIRSRSTEKPLLLPNGFAVPLQHRPLAARLELNSVTANTMCVFDDLPASSFLDGCSIEWTGTMLKDSGVIIGGNIGSNGGSAACERAVTVGLSPATGFLTVWEATAPGTYTATVLGAVDLSLGSHLYRFALTSAGQLTAYVDGVAIGAPVALAGPYRGGLPGLWKNGSAGALTITNVSRVWGL
jgi:hypothetical protein